VAPGCSEASSRPPGTYLTRANPREREEPAIANPFPACYRAAMRHAGGGCPLEAGLLGRLADHECAHGRLPGDRTPKCGCWAQEAAPVIQLRDAAPIGNVAAERRAA
jgi:hypothetical protein